MPLSVDVTIDWSLPGGAQLVDEDRAAALLRHGLMQEGQDGSWEFAIRFVGDAEMSRLHERYLNDPSPTDIMTFPYDPDDGELGGDIVISVDTAAENASDHDWSTRSELEFLMLHGLLHVLGWDDHNESNRAAMLARQYELLETWSRDADR